MLRQMQIGPMKIVYKISYNALVSLPHCFALNPSAVALNPSADSLPKP